VPVPADRGPAVLRAVPGWLRALTPDGRDAFLYGVSALFAGITAVAMRIPLYREWGRLAVGPYVAATLVMGGVLLVRRSRARAAGALAGPPAPEGARPGRAWQAARLGAFAIALLGATVVPLALEVVWASHGDASLHVQPEVLVVERAGIRAAHGEDPYQVVDRNGHIVIRQRAIPVYELYYPYLPGMVVFGFSSGSRVEARLRATRVTTTVNRRNWIRASVSRASTLLPLEKPKTTMPGR